DAQLSHFRFDLSCPADSSWNRLNLHSDVLRDPAVFDDLQRSRRADPVLHSNSPDAFGVDAPILDDRRPPRGGERRRDSVLVEDPGGATNVRRLEVAFAALWNDAAENRN